MSHHQTFLSFERHGFSRKVKQSSELGWVVLSGGPVWGSSQAGTGVGVGLEYVQLDAGEGSLFPLVLSPGGEEGRQQSDLTEAGLGTSGSQGRIK